MLLLFDLELLGFSIYFSFEFLILLVLSFEFLYAFKLSFYLGFANPDSHTNKLHAVHTLHCILYAVHNTP